MRMHEFFAGMVAIGCVAGCGASPEPAPQVAADEPSVDPDEAFGTEAWGIGTSWYDYDSTTHAVTPKPEVYAVVDEGSTIFFEVTGYYDERGESGHFTLATESGTLPMDSNVKDSAACVALEPLREVSCESEADLYLTTMRRPLPDAGFAVRSPGLWVVPAEDRQVWVVSAGSVADVTDGWQELAEPVDSVAQAPGASRVSDPSGIHVQLDGDLNLSAWAYTDGAFSFRCAAADWDDDQPLRRSVLDTVDVPTAPGTYTVRFCADGAALGAVESAQSQLGLWPDGDYDLIVEVGVDGPSFKLHPGVLHWRWSQTEGIDAVATASVWEGYEQ